MMCVINDKEQKQQIARKILSNLTDCVGMSGILAKFILCLLNKNPIYLTIRKCKLQSRNA